MFFIALCFGGLGWSWVAESALVIWIKTAAFARPDWGWALFLIAFAYLGYFCALRRCRVVRPAAQALFLAAKKSPPKKAALLTASPSLRYGATCGARARGVRRNSLHAARSALTAAANQMTKLVCPAAHQPPHALCSSAHSEGRIRKIASL